MKRYKVRSAFEDTLLQNGVELTRDETTTLQINVGLACDLVCRDCHLEAGPARTELMNEETVEAVIACAKRFNFASIDITGGAPELLPQLPLLVERLAPLTSRLIVRTNLTALARPESAALPDLYSKQRVVIVASLPAVNASQSESQRGGGTWETSLAVLRRLNGIGYGMEGSGLELDLIANPTGAFLPPSQEQTARRFREVLERKWGITFNHLFAFANVPLGRFRHWLERSGNLETYMARLAAGFNPCAVPGLMCRTMISVSWDGFLFDCDFNLARGLPLGGRRIHISELADLPAPGTSIAVSDHCYTCTAGAGFT